MILFIDVMPDAKLIRAPASNPQAGQAPQAALPFYQQKAAGRGRPEWADCGLETLL